jgi:hypothetical protein
LIRKVREALIQAQQSLDFSMEMNRVLGEQLEEKAGGKQIAQLPQT